jgi:hypothetical protein
MKSRFRTILALIMFAIVGTVALSACQTDDSGMQGADYDHPYLGHGGADGHGSGHG